MSYPHSLWINQPPKEDYLVIDHICLHKFFGGQRNMVWIRHNAKKWAGLFYCSKMVVNWVEIEGEMIREGFFIDIWTLASCAVLRFEDCTLLHTCRLQTEKTKLIDFSVAQCSSVHDVSVRVVQSIRWTTRRSVGFTRHWNVKRRIETNYSNKLTVYLYIWLFTCELFWVMSRHVCCIIFILHQQERNLRKSNKEFLLNAKITPYACLVCFLMFS